MHATEDDIIYEKFTSEMSCFLNSVVGSLALLLKKHYIVYFSKNIHV